MGLGFVMFPSAKAAKPLHLTGDLSPRLVVADFPPGLGYFRTTVRKTDWESTLNPKPKPKTLNHNPEPKPKTLDQHPEPKPKTLNHNPKPRVLGLHQHVVTAGGSVSAVEEARPSPVPLGYIGP